MEYRIIGIDCGHPLTGIGTGANGIRKEVTINRNVFKELKALSKGTPFIFKDCTQDKPSTSVSEDLRKRVAKAENYKVDLFISLHCNAFNGTAHGTETYLAKSWLSTSMKAKNKRIAEIFQSNVAKSCDFYDRGVKYEDFYVIYNTSMEAILLEIMFCDSKKDNDKLNYKKVAQAILDSVYEVNGIDNTPKPVPPKPSTPREKMVIYAKEYDRPVAEILGIKYKCKVYPVSDTIVNTTKYETYGVGGGTFPKGTKIVKGKTYKETVFEVYKRL